MDIVILGLDEPGGREFLHACQRRNDRVVGIGVTSPAALVDDLLKELPDLRGLALRSGSYNEAREGVSVYLGKGGTNRLIEALHPDTVADFLYGHEGAKAYEDLVKADVSIALGTPEPILVDGVDPDELAGVELAQERLVEAIELAKSAPKDAAIALIYRPDTRFENISAKKLFKMKGSQLAQAGLSPRGAIEAALMVDAYTDLAVCARLSQRPITDFKAMFGRVETAQAALLVDNQPQVRNPEGALVAAEDLSLVEASDERYPMLNHLVDISTRFGYRGDVINLAVIQAAVTACAEDCIDLSTAESTIRQLTSSYCRQYKAPKDEEEARQLFNEVSHRALEAVEMVAKAIANGNYTDAVKRSKQLNRIQTAATRESEQARRERKKASRWKNDPAKKELWNEHEHERQVRAKRKQENERRASRRMAAVKRAEETTDRFPVVIVDDERADRAERLKRREQHRNPRTRSKDSSKSHETERGSFNSKRQARDRSQHEDERHSRTERTGSHRANRSNKAEEGFHSNEQPASRNRSRHEGERDSHSEHRAHSRAGRGKAHSSELHSAKPHSSSEQRFRKKR